MNGQARAVAAMDAFSYQTWFAVRYAHVAAATLLIGGAFTNAGLSASATLIPDSSAVRAAAILYERLFWLAVAVSVATGISNLGLKGDGLLGPDTTWGAALFFKLTAVFALLIVSLVRSDFIVRCRAAAKMGRPARAHRARGAYWITVALLLGVLWGGLGLAHGRYRRHARPACVERRHVPRDELHDSRHRHAPPARLARLLPRPARHAHWVRVLPRLLDDDVDRDAHGAHVCPARRHRPRSPPGTSLMMTTVHRRLERRSCSSCSRSDSSSRPPARRVHVGADRAASHAVRHSHGVRGRVRDRLGRGSGGYGLIETVVLQISNALLRWTTD